MVKKHQSYKRAVSLQKPRSSTENICSTPTTIKNSQTTISDFLPQEDFIAEPAAESLIQSVKFRVARKLNTLYTQVKINPTFLIIPKAIVVIASFCLFFYLKSTNARGIGPTDAHTCLYDKTINFYSATNYVLRSSNNLWLRHGLMILSSELIDLIFLSICVVW